MKKMYVAKMAKRAGKALPVIFFSVAVMLFLVFACMEAFQTNAGIRVGVVMPPEDRLMSALLHYMEDTNRLSDVCEFEMMDEKAGREELERGEVSALVVIPEGLIEKVNRNEEAGVRVLLPEERTLDAGMIEEFSQAGVNLVLSAKAGSYTAYDLYRRYGAGGSVKQVAGDIGKLYLSFLMMQERMVDDHPLRDGNDMSDRGRLMTAGLTCILILAGIPAAGFMRPADDALAMQLHRRGVSAVFMQLTTTALLTACLCGAGLCAMAAVYGVMGLKGNFALSLPALFLVCFMAASLLTLLYSMSRHAAGAALAVFLLALLFVFLPGGLFPSYVLPRGLVNFGRLLPGYFSMKTLYLALWRGRAGWEWLYPAGYGIVFCALNCAYAASGEKNRVKRVRMRGGGR